MDSKNSKYLQTDCLKEKPIACIQKFFKHHPSLVLSIWKHAVKIRAWQDSVQRPYNKDNACMAKGKYFCLCAVYQGHSELVITPTECSSSFSLIQRVFYCRLSSMGPGHTAEHSPFVHQRTMGRDTNVQVF